MCFNTQPPEGGWLSRVKPYPLCGGFNTQPPEGGWISTVPRLRRRRCFNTQPPEGGWHPPQPRSRTMTAMFQHTAARRRLGRCGGWRICWILFQHTAARRRLACAIYLANSEQKSFNTQPPEGGWVIWSVRIITFRSFNTQPPEGGWFWMRSDTALPVWFQHTAARRRLAQQSNQKRHQRAVSTHSRPKAAGGQPS